MADRITKDILKNQAFTLSRLTGRMLYVSYECGYANLFERAEKASRNTISYGNTKRELSDQMTVAIRLITLMKDEERRRKNGE